MLIETLYVWTEEGNEGEGVIVAFIPPLGQMGPLQSRRRDVAELLRPLAEGHRKASGNAVRLVRFERGLELERLP